MCRTRLWIIPEYADTRSLNTSSFDEALSLQTESVKIAHRTQQVIACQSSVTTTTDPLGGSYHVESLADRVEQEVPSELDRIRDNASTQQVGTETGSRKMVGVNVLTESKPSRRAIHKIQSAPWRRQIQD
jgi:methylmalonyl-CoA mutase N-terminal domain/subunit